MPREEYHDSLTALCSAVHSMGQLVLEQLDDALTAMRESDESLARAVIDGDDAINDRYLEIESSCIDLFALQQPVAGELRVVAAAFKITTDLERVGDLATNLGRYTLATERTLHPEVDIQAIGQDAHDLLADAAETFIISAETALSNVPKEGMPFNDRKDIPAACQKIAERDDDIDVLCQRGYEWVVRGLIEREAGNDDAWDLERVLDDVTRLLLTIRDLERIGDHAVNIAARTLYVAENDASLVY